MSLLGELIKEMASAGTTGAHAVAGGAGSLFGGGLVRRTGKKMVGAERISTEMAKKIKNRNSWKWKILGEMVDGSDFDPSDVISKLDAAEKKASMDEDTVPFGMEDEDGNIVKVYVRAEQADDFEQALGAMLAGEDEDEDESNTASEIAEVLFQLKDKFDIVDVQWPEIQGDEEEEQEMEGDPAAEGGDEMDLEGDPAAEGGDEMDLEGDAGGEEMDLEGGEDLEGDMEMEPEGGAESQLQQVIDMMKSDAEARKAESEARAAEAQARAAEANAMASASKVKQEEEVLDMETFNKDQKSQEDEAKRLAQLAKYKHDSASKAEALLSAETPEEDVDVDMDVDVDAAPEEEEATKHEKRRRPQHHGDMRDAMGELAHLMKKYLQHN